MPSFFTILSVASSIGQAFASYQQAAAMQAYYDAQADLSKLEYASKRAQAKEDGVRVLREVNKALGSALAQAAAGGILGTEGSALMQQQVTLRAGAEDFRMANLNAELLTNMGALEYNNLKQAGNVKLQAGAFDALTGFGTDLVNIEQAGLFEPVKQKIAKAKEGLMG
jgi:hypothetical protein